MINLFFNISRRRAKIRSMSVTYKKYNKFTCKRMLNEMKWCLYQVELLKIFPLNWLNLV
ncbi:cytosolic protein [Lactobacillus sp. HMSC25A02]|uniref:Putative cytosolic protein n=2 Tax=Lacticaseibacillus paracasei TaxID=1597 RepID=A0A829GWM1_LACPA|nr:cytosolic protein [Lacticaseibacillus paracasei]EPC40437.1 putative cytosolic protein [Lacticaseibacillus paracasei subsp. paracasei Lpp74]EPC47619.1 putative cytosolic protein [Lacticaseibacillus paracasei subsp. paracasei Lpp123]EPC65290.1 putative cytosolic protein [Lacticaseibacillus paracasei subsp. tolerans Lpl14]EPC90616.1 putative cytosolic protein [Lacticaseibacillus paracasei subsp. paracasei Lpp227]EPC97917.1 putative cytosolic protein [Lacticaseibacillus paracasei subsp. paracas